MEFKKCIRCGCFFTSNDNICCNCESKDRYDIAKINNILEDNDTFNSIEELSSFSGVNLNNLNRFIKNNKISGFENTNI